MKNCNFLCHRFEIKANRWTKGKFRYTITQIGWKKCRNKTKTNGKWLIGKSSRHRSRWTSDWCLEMNRWLINWAMNDLNNFRRFFLSPTHRASRHMGQEMKATTATEAFINNIFLSFFYFKCDKLKIHQSKPMAIVNKCPPSGHLTINNGQLSMETQ